MRFVKSATISFLPGIIVGWLLAYIVATPLVPTANAQRHRELDPVQVASNCPKCFWEGQYYRAHRDDGPTQIVEGPIVLHRVRGDSGSTAYLYLYDGDPDADGILFYKGYLVDEVFDIRVTNGLFGRSSGSSAVEGMVFYVAD